MQLKCVCFNVFDLNQSDRAFRISLTQFHRFSVLLLLLVPIVLYKNKVLDVPEHALAVWCSTLIEQVCILKICFYQSLPLGLDHLYTLPVDPWALDAEQHTQVDGSPARSRLSAVTAQLVAWQALYPLKKAFSPYPNPAVGPLSRLAGRVDAARWGGGCPVQALHKWVKSGTWGQTSAAGTE